MAFMLTFDLDKWYIHECVGHYPAKLLKLFLFVQIVLLSYVYFKMISRSYMLCLQIMKTP